MRVVAGVTGAMCLNFRDLAHMDHSVINVGGEAMHRKEIKQSIAIKQMTLNVNTIRFGGIQSNIQPAN